MIKRREGFWKLKVILKSNLSLQLLPYLFLDCKNFEQNRKPQAKSNQSLKILALEKKIKLQVRKSTNDTKEKENFLL